MMSDTLILRLFLSSLLLALVGPFFAMAFEVSPRWIVVVWGPLVFMTLVAIWRRVKL